VVSLATASILNSLGGIPLSVSMDDEGGVASVEFEASSESYYILLFGETVTGIEPVALIDGSRASGIFPAIDSVGDQRSGFFAVQSFSLSDPHDADLDGMDDVFESTWQFLNPFDPMDADLDQDGDGLTNFEEYVRGTDLNSRDTYALESLSESFVVGKVGSVESVRAQVSDAGLGVDGALLVLETIAPGGRVFSTTINADPNGLLQHAVPVLPGTTKVTVRGRSALNELVYFISSATFLPIPNLGQDYLAGERGTFLATVEGEVPSWWQFGGSVDVILLNEKEERRESFHVGKDGSVTYSARIPPGRSTIRFSSPDWPGQNVTFTVFGKTAVAEALEFVDPVSTRNQWLTARSSKVVRVLATSSDGQGIGGVEVSLAVPEGKARLEPSVGFTNREGELVVEVTPESAGLLSLVARSRDQEVEARFPVAPLTYDAHLRPVFQKCTACHHEDHPLPLLTFEQIRYGIGSRAGQAIVDPSRPDESPLVFMTRAEEGEMFLNTQCCLATPPLTVDDSDLIREWVASGALEAFIQAGEPVELRTNGGLDQVGVPGTTVPEIIRFVVLDALGVVVPLVGVTVTSESPLDRVTMKSGESDFSGEIHVQVDLSEDKSERVLSLEAPDFELSKAFQLKINPSYRGGVLSGSEHPFDKALLSVLKPLNLEPTIRSSRSEFVKRVVEDATGRHPDLNDPDLGEFLRTYFSSQDTKEDRNVLIDGLIHSRPFLRHWVSERISTWVEVPAKADPRDGEPRFDEPLIEMLEADDSLARMVEVIGLLGGDEPEWGQSGSSEAGFAITSTHDVMDGGKNSFEKLFNNFTGASIGCARCHDHKLTEPQDDPLWTQAQAYEMYAFSVTSPDALNVTQADGSKVENKLSYPVWWGDGEGKRLESQNSIFDPDINWVESVVSRRAELWGRVTRSPIFYRAVGHRIWGEIVGQLVDPLDIRESTLRPLRESGMIRFFNSLEDEFRGVDSRLGEFLHLCFTSNVYQLSSEENGDYDSKADVFLGRFPVRRRFAEVLSHGMHVASKTPFESHREIFLQVLGYPARRLVPFWDHRRDSAGVSEALMVLNSRDSSAWKAGQASSRIQSDFASRLALVDDLGRHDLFVELASELVFESLLRSPSIDELIAIEELDPTVENLVDLVAALTASSEFLFR
jgi:hypothetical protein